ncbi:antitoxin VapB family protein [Natrinema salaciae]|nr:antitoxin VapB family protein [Natrinema salaciae]
MSTKTVTITEEAYERLKSHKRDDESFTDTVLRLTESNRDVMKGFGAFADADGFRAAVEEAGENLDDGVRERRERLRERHGRSSDQ